MSGNRATGHERIDHKFNFEQFDYDTPPAFQPLIKMQFFFSKLPEVSYEHFFKHYAHVHADLTVAAKSFGAHHVRRYTQHADVGYFVQQHQTPEMKEKVKGMGFLGIELLDYDGCSTLWFKTWDDAERFFKSPEYAALGADCSHFLDTSRGFKMLAGHELVCFGKTIPDVDDKDGVTEYLNT